MKYKQSNFSNLNHRPTSYNGGYLHKENKKYLLVYSNTSLILSNILVDNLNKLFIDSEYKLKFNHTISSKGILVRQGGGKGRIIKECRKINKGEILFKIELKENSMNLLRIINNYSFLTYYIK